MKLGVKRVIIYAIVAGIMIAIMAAAFNSCARNPKPEVSESFAMDTIITQTIYTDDESVTQGLAQMFQDIDYKMSKTIEASDVSKMNGANGETVTVSGSVSSLLTRCIAEAEATDGAFDPALGKVIDAWGFGSGAERVPTEEELGQLLAQSGYTKLSINQTHVNTGGAYVDLGGAAKGYALDQARLMLEERGISSALVTAGGSVLAYGTKPDGKLWVIGIRDPQGSESEYMATMQLRDACVSTSGIYERGFEQDGVYYHHIIDPETGMPVDNDLLSVTVVDEDGTLTDIYSTALFVMGRQKGLSFAEENGIDAVFITKDKEVYKTKGFDYQFALENSDYHEAA